MISAAYLSTAATLPYMEAGHRLKALVCTSSAGCTTSGLSSLLILLLSSCVLLWLSLLLLLNSADSFEHQQQYLQQQQHLLYLGPTVANIAPTFSFRCFAYRAHAVAAAGEIAGRWNARRQIARCPFSKTPKIGSVAGDQCRWMMGGGARLGDGPQYQQQRWEELILVRQMETVKLPPGRGLRVHCLSDLHTDYRTNIAW